MLYQLQKNGKKYQVYARSKMALINFYQDAIERAEKRREQAARKHCDISLRANEATVKDFIENAEIIPVPENQVPAGARIIGEKSPYDLYVKHISVA